MLSITRSFMKMFTLGVFTKAEFFEGFVMRVSDDDKPRLNDNVMPHIYLDGNLDTDKGVVKNGYIKKKRCPDGTFFLTRDFDPTNKNILLYIRVRFSPDKVCTIVSDKSNKRIVWSNRQNSQSHSDERKSIIIMIVPGCQVRVEVGDRGLDGSVHSIKTLYILENNNGSLDFQNLSGRTVNGYDFQEEKKPQEKKRLSKLKECLLDPLWKYFTGFSFGHKRQRSLAGTDLRSS